MQLEQIMQQLSDQQLRAGYDEMEGLRNEGVLQDGIVRDVLRKWKTVNSLASITDIGNAFYYEIASRWRKGTTNHE